MNKVIYDLGSNNGDDIPYYLMKGDVVVAVEANPHLCDLIRRRFSSEITQGRVFVESVVVTDGNELGDVFFYRHKFNHVISQFPKPKEIENFEEIVLPSLSIIELINKYGSPYYIKIDIEHYDEYILRALFKNNIMPPFISAESHSIEVFALLVASGRYNAFKMVDGDQVSREYQNHKILTLEGRSEIYSFPRHSAGPFGDDIKGEWIRSDSFHRLLAFSGLGWKDIHATNIREASSNESFRIRHYLLSEVRKKLLGKFRICYDKKYRKS
jgi:FkbM family methyltransferase